MSFTDESKKNARPDRVGIIIGFAQGYRRRTTYLLEEYDGTPESGRRAEWFAGCLRLPMMPSSVMKTNRRRRTRAATFDRTEKCVKIENASGTGVRRPSFDTLVGLVCVCVCVSACGARLLLTVSSIVVQVRRRVRASEC